MIDREKERVYVHTKHTCIHERERCRNDEDIYLSTSSMYPCPLSIYLPTKIVTSKLIINFMTMIHFDLLPGGKSHWYVGRYVAK